jgi:hypothetical protein
MPNNHAIMAEKVRDAERESKKFPIVLWVVWLRGKIFQKCVRGDDIQSLH